MKNIFFFTILFFAGATVLAQCGYWQQHVDYDISIVMDVKQHQFTGTQTLVYTNNSPDTLKEVFYQLYYNAFQPGSMMAERTENVPDPDKRMEGKFAELTQSEIGYQKIMRLEQDGQPMNFEIIGTILKAQLRQPILPGQVATFSMDFNAQVPIQIRRSGRINKEGIDYTMTQWYPKLCEYDEDGWHPYQYLGREFYGVWGDFNVKITINKNYIIGGTGVLQNPEEIGYGYQTKEKKKRQKGKMLTWHFKAENVHDFAWAADPDFTHDSFQIEGGPEVHLFYNSETAYVDNWKKCHQDIERYFNFMATNYGKYAYPQFSLIQGGDGGMEYPMCTMMLGSGKDYRGFFGLFAHEATHNWYYGMLGSNEQRYHWMDEGFTSYAEEEAMNFVFNRDVPNPHINAVGQYITSVFRGFNEPMSTPADHFETNGGYVVAAYRMGELFLMQLEYIIGQDNFKKGMLTYYNRWAFKHPKPEDVIKAMEDVSGIQLDWFLVYWTQLMKVTDYAITDVQNSAPRGVEITLTNLGNRPMPMDVQITYKDGMSELYTIPLVSMYGGKDFGPYRIMQAWPWTRKEYKMMIDANLDEIDAIIIDPEQKSCDVIPQNNEWVAGE